MANTNDFLSSVPRFIKKLVLFLSSYIPLFLFLIINSLDFNKNVLHQLCQLKLHFFFIIIIVLLSIKIVCYSKQKSKVRLDGKYYNQLEKTGDNVISYLMTYIVPLMTTIQNGKIDCNNLIINLFLFIIIGIVYIKQDLVYLNPLLSCMGINIYKTKGQEHYIISKLSIHSIQVLEDGHTGSDKNELSLYRITDTTSFLKKNKK